eukprot:517975-Amphidinium_carterae.1
MQQADPTFSQPQQKAMLAASQQLKQLTIKGCSREELASKIQSEAKRLHVQPALGLQNQSHTKPDKPSAESKPADTDGYQTVTRRKPKKPKPDKPRSEQQEAQLPKRKVKITLLTAQITHNHTAIP